MAEKIALVSDAENILSVQSDLPSNKCITVAELQAMAPILNLIKPNTNKIRVHNYTETGGLSGKTYFRFSTYSTIVGPGQIVDFDINGSKTLYYYKCNEDGSGNPFGGGSQFINGVFVIGIGDPDQYYAKGKVYIYEPRWSSSTKQYTWNGGSNIIICS